VLLAAPVAPETAPFIVLAVPPTAPDSVLLAVVARLVVARLGLLSVAVRPAVCAVVLLTRTAARNLEFSLSAALADTLTMFSRFTEQSSLGSHRLMIVSHLHPFFHQEGVSESMSRQFRR